MASASPLVLVLGMVLLASCGGGSSGSSGSSSSISMSGVAATGAAMGNAGYRIKCAAGSAAGTTAVDGSYSAVVPGGAFPCAVEVTDGQRKLHVVTLGSSTGFAVANVTPLTEQLVGQLSADTADFFDNFNAAGVTATKVKVAQDMVFAALSANGVLVPPSLTNLIEGTLVAKNLLQPGNDYDKLLDVVAASPVSVKLIAMNDFHGNIESPATSNGGTVFLPDSTRPAGSTATVGGAAYLSTLIKTLKAKNPNNIVVGAGDMVGASPFTSNITHEEAAVDILNQIGLEVTSVGNHEFDKGKTELLRIQNGGCFPRAGTTGIVGTDTCLVNGQFAGASYKYLAANVVDTASGKTLMPATYIKQFGLVSVGFIGLTLRGTPAVVTASGVAGLRFDEESAVINRYAAQLKANGVTAVVVLIHQGGQTTASTLNDQTCPGLTGDILPIMDKLSTNVDVVVSGHTHQEYACSYKGKLLTSTGFYGGAVSEIDLTLTPGKGLKSASAKTVPVIQADTNAYLPSGFSAVAKDPVIDAAVKRYSGLSAALQTLAVGSITAGINRALLTGTTNRDETAEGAMGDVLADTYLAGGPAADIGIINPGGVRADLRYRANGSVSYGDLLTVAPFGNTLVTLDLTGAQLLRLLEQQWEVPNATAKTGLNGGGRMLQVSKGITYTWDFSKPLGAAAGGGSRIMAGSLKLNGIAIDPIKTYKITTNSFLADGGDNFTVMATGKNRINSGVIDIDAFVTYMRSNSPLSPPAPRITRLN